MINRITATLSLVMVLLTPGWVWAVDISFQDLEGKEQRLSDFSGKWVVVNYWATWCPPCLEEIPDLVHFHEDHKDKDAVVLGFNMEDIKREQLVQFVDDNFVTYPIIPMDGDVELVGSVPGLPTTYIIGPDGNIMARKVGSVSAEGIEAFIAKHTKANP